MQLQVNWDSFKVYNQDADGLKIKFEHLCRQIFARESLSKNKTYRYLNSTPENPGLECEPILDEINNRRIGFQAKHFNNRPDYTDIKDSAEKVVKYYYGKVDHVFLFSNKKLTPRSMDKTRKILGDAGITLETITDNAILDLVRNKYPDLALYYFGNHTIEKSWFMRHTSIMLEMLGERYNSEFNVDTVANKELSLFVIDQDAVDYINSKKVKLLEEISNIYLRYDEYRGYFGIIEDTIKSLPDVDSSSITEAFAWSDELRNRAQKHVFDLEVKIKNLEIELEKYDSLAFGDNENIDTDKRNEARNNYNETVRSINKLQQLLDLPALLELSERERSLVLQNSLFIYGSAGTGKSQLLANEVKQLEAAGRDSLLLLAGMYFADEPILDQIMKNLHLDYRFEDLVDILENIGELNKQVVPIFVDALNETWHRTLWKIGLSEILEIISNAPMVKLVITYRPEYECELLSELKRSELKENRIPGLNHIGFANNTISAIRDFFNHYNIPFSPYEYFGYEMTNPLFLKLYCETYNGEEVDLPTLYERVIEKASSKIYKALEKEMISLGYSEGDNILKPLINELSRILLSNDARFISRNDFSKMSYWNDYGMPMASIVSLLTKEHVLYNTMYEGNERYFFSYDQMNDYYCAKAIFELFHDKIEIRDYLSKQVLQIENGHAKQLWNIDLFINACALFKEVFDEECIDIIDNISDKDEQREIFAKYIESFQWRKGLNISKECFLDAIRKYPCSVRDLWETLIGNSIKPTNPLNAEFLHGLLQGYELNRRDYLWTIYINKLTDYEDNRIVQLVETYNRGERLVIDNSEQKMLLLTLFAWLLTSSNRWLRDCTSKAMIEILRQDVSLCKPLLERFNDVNDPYVIQRLYGIAFGACSKRIDDSDYRDLAEYVYRKIFKQEKVYPDILLRDYAKLIIDLYIHEFPEMKGLFEYELIDPPYNSDPIPNIEDQQYENKDKKGLFWLMHSMNFDWNGAYGDFGRYIFQAALRSFDVDQKKIFNYAMYFILNDLCYLPEYFEENDNHCASYDRHNTIKIERIGKKYQWIAMYNILARVSDHCDFVDIWCDDEETIKAYRGAWSPRVRDFDPTLNSNHIKFEMAPYFGYLEELYNDAQNEIKNTLIDTKKQKEEWLNSPCVISERIKDSMMLTDAAGMQWICLTGCCTTDRKRIKDDKLFVWNWSYGYFLTQQQVEICKALSSRTCAIITDNIASFHEVYSVFDGEYPWSSSYGDNEKDAWIEVSLKTGEKETINTKVPDFDLYLSNMTIEDTEPRRIYMGNMPLKEISRTVDVEKEIGKILHAVTDLIWEGEYDATNEETISRSVPCAELVRTMMLTQKEYVGLFFDEEGKLAAFDLEYTQGKSGVMVRKDILDSFISKSGMQLVWFVNMNKEIHDPDIYISNFSNWESIFFYENDVINGELHRCPSDSEN